MQLFPKKPQDSAAETSQPFNLIPEAEARVIVPNTSLVLYTPEPYQNGS